MVQAQAERPFVKDIRSIAETVGPLNDAKAQAFLEQYPVEAVFRELSEHISSDIIEEARVALEKVFNTAYGSALLPHLVPYAANVLQQGVAAPPLRQLAVHQLARLLHQVALQLAEQQQQQQGASQQAQELIGLLLGTLRDEDVGVAAAAERALAALGVPPATALLPALIRDPPAAPTLRQLAASPDPVLSIRALTLVLRLAAGSPEAGAAVAASEGLLQPLLAQLRDPGDVLTCTAALQLVREAAEGCDAGMTALLAEAVAPALGALMQPGVDVVLQCASMQAGAALLTAALDAGQGPMAIDTEGGSGGGSGPSASPHALLSAIKAVLDVGGEEEFAQELEEAALDAVGTIGLKAPGATALLLDPSHLFADVAYKAFGRAPNPASRVCALHAVAAIAGAERATGAGGRQAAVLEPAAEDALRAAVFEGALASSPTATPASVVLGYLGQPFPELRVAVYRALSALLLRDWMAVAVCSDAELLAFLLNPDSESGRQGCEWRHATVVALAGTIRVAVGTAGAAAAGADVNGVGHYHAVLAAAAQRVDDAVAAGPYGGHRAAPREHLVATIHRGGGGL